MGSVAHILLVQAYWFSLLPIGYALLRYVLMNAAKVRPQLAPANGLLAKQHFVVKALLGFATINVAFASFSIFFYLFRAPSQFASLLYLLLLAICLGYFGRFSGRKLLNWARLGLANLWRGAGLTRATWMLAIAILLFDYLFSLWVGAYAHGDAIFHMSRVLSILYGGFNVHPGFMSNVLESAYHYNVLYALYIPPCQLFHIEPMTVWRYSIAFFRLTLWASIGVFSYYLYRRWLLYKALSSGLTALTVIASAATMSGSFFTATYPNEVVYIWMILYVMILDFFGRPDFRQAVLLALVSLIVTTTHPTYALILVGFTLWYIIVQAICDRQRPIVQSLRYFAPALIVLAASPAISRLIATQTTSSQFHIMDPQLVHWGKLTFINPLQDAPQDTIGWVLLVAGAVATLGILCKLWRKRSLPLALALLSFYPIIAYTPVFGLANSFLPAWLLQRFQFMNLIAYAYIPLAVVFILESVRHLSKRHFRILSKPAFFQLLAIIMVLIVSAITIGPAYGVFYQSKHLNDYMYPYYADVNASFGAALPPRKVVLSTLADSYMLAGVLPVDVVAVEQGHSPTSANTDARILCQGYLINNFPLEELRLANVDYIMLPATGQEDGDGRRVLASSKPYLHLLQQTPRYYLYAVDRSFA
ncbi:MAG TPA: hypothetical protein VHQ86_01770, partial [Candidatus Saccharimonadia bacterium]|nr:hypothetical protein [Candidatus Saccharimonadia bacterium]